MDMKRFFLYAIVIAALALAGCGSDGNGGMVDNGMPDPTPDPTCPEGQEGTPPNCAPPGPTPEQIAAATKAADTKRDAIADEATDETNAGLGGESALGDNGEPGGGDDTYSLAIERGASSATKVTITDSALDGDDDPKFMQAMDLGGGLTMHTRTMKADEDGNVVEEVVMVKTDIDAAKPTAFAKVTGQALNARADGDAPVDNDADMTNNSDSLSIVADNVEHVSATAFASSTGAGTINFKADNAETDANEAAMVSGTFNGAMGTYVCTGATACTVTLADDKVTEVSDGWVFTPAAGATSPVADDDYLRYGFWLKKTTDDDGVLTYNEVETFAYSSLDEATNVGTVTGTAKYDGDAVGVYVMDTYKSDGDVDASTSGHFTADVNLTANFGTPTSIAADDHNTITGTISGFDLSGGEDASGWEVDVAGDIDNNGVTNGMAKGSGDDGPMGSFTGMFHGNDMNDDSDPIAPKALVGEFNADFGNGAVAGAYGARKQPPMTQ